MFYDHSITAENIPVRRGDVTGSHLSFGLGITIRYRNSDTVWIIIYKSERHGLYLAGGQQKDILKRPSRYEPHSSILVEVSCYKLVGNVLYHSFRSSSSHWGIYFSCPPPPSPLPPVLGIPHHANVATAITISLDNLEGSKSLLCLMQEATVHCPALPCCSRQSLLSRSGFNTTDAINAYPAA